MSPSGRRQIEEPLRKYAERDPELFQELRAKLAGTLDERVAETARVMSVAAEAPLVPDSETARRIAETIVRPNARPVLTVRDNRATVEFLGPDSQVWADRILAAQAGLDRVIPAVGRVEVSNNPDYTWVGTGWLVADDIIVTNRHVAREFGRRSGQGFSFRPGTNGGPMSSRIDFLEEDQRFASLEYALTTILWIAPSSEPDVAFLRVTRAVGDRPLPPPIALAQEVATDIFIATIGYPARDSRVPDQDLVLQIFGDVYEKKRLAPGQVIEVRPDELEHDCSTLGGNSGSVLVDLRTAEAVGLHFSGLFLEANFAVPAPKLRDLLRRVQQGDLPGAASSTITQPAAPPVLPQTESPGTFTFHLQIPVEITVKVGGAIFPGGMLPLPAGGLAASDVHENALRAARAAMAGNPDVLDVRLGYRFKRGWITDERVIVVEVREKKTVAELRAEGTPLIPPQVLGVGVDVRTAALATQLEHLGVDLSALLEKASPGRYREPQNLSLDRVKEKMTAIFHVSPDSGFPNLKAFLGRVKRRLTATMYEWDADHISDAIEDSMAPDGNSLRMVTQRDGTASAVKKMKSRLGGKFKHVWASVGSGKLIPRSYHIKVASRDGEEFWLSSGNWKRSGQPDIDPAGEHSTSMKPLRYHNREWHVVIANPKLATMFQKYIEFDFQEAERVPLDEGLEAVLPDLFLPERAFLEGVEEAVTAQYFSPLRLDRELDVQPLLTPDRDAHGNRLFMATAIKMVQGATKRIYVENQSFALLDDNNDEFDEFLEALRNKQKAEVDVRIIFRDTREFGDSALAEQQRVLERIQDFGFDTDFVRLQKGCHTKGIIVDTSEVLIGSHNLTNTGSLFNRDASLLIRDPEVAKYFEEIFLFDWNALAKQEADELVGGMRLAQPGEETPIGFRRVSLAELLGDS